MKNNKKHEKLPSMIIVKMRTTRNDGTRLNVTRLKKKSDLKVELTINNIKIANQLSIVVANWYQSDLIRLIFIRDFATLFIN